MNFEYEETAPKKEYFATFNGFFIFFFSIIVIAWLGTVVEDYFHTDVIIKIAAFIMGVFIYSIIPLAVFKRR